MIGKPIVTFVTAIVMALIGFLDDHVISSLEWVLILSVALNAFVVYVVPNLNAGVAKYAKAITQAFIAAVGALILLWSGGVDLSEWLQVLVAFLGSLGVV